MLFVKKKKINLLSFILLLTFASASFSEETSDTVSTSNGKTSSGKVETRKYEPYIGGLYPTYPPTTAATGDDEALIKRGEYLAKIGDCIACHTNVKDNLPAFAGGLGIETPFGVFYSPNITPDKETGIGNWSEQDFIQALKHGRRPNGQNYFPVFPYIYFSNVTDDDARALYAYFMSIPAVNLKNKSQLFPFNLPGSSLGMWFWNLMFFYPNTPYSYDPNQSPEWNRGKYIVDGLGHCSMCHTPMNIFGAPKTRYYLTGSFVDGYWAPNITKFGLHSVTRHEVAKVFAEGQLLNRAGPVVGPMAEVNHNSLNYLTNADQLAIASYLKTIVSDVPYNISPSDAQPSLKRGKQVYVDSCILCHQNGAMSAPRIGDGSNWFRRLQSNGLTGLYRHTINGYNSMPIKGACVTCSDNDLIAAVDYILNKSLTRSQWADVESGRSAKYPTSGKDIYAENCSVCHEEGKLGAPKTGDKKVWQPLIDQNFDVLVAKTLNNKHHPVCTQCTNAEVIDAVKYIVSKSKQQGNYTLW